MSVVIVDEIETKDDIHVHRKPVPSHENLLVRKKSVVNREVVRKAAIDAMELHLLDAIAEMNGTKSQKSVAEKKNKAAVDRRRPRGN